MSNEFHVPPGLTIESKKLGNQVTMKRKTGKKEKVDIKTDNLFSKQTEKKGRKNGEEKKRQHN